MKTFIKAFAFATLALTFSCGETGGSTVADGGKEEALEVTVDGNSKLNLLVDAFNTFSTTAYKQYDNYTATFGNDPEKYEQLRDWYGGGKFNDTYFGHSQDIEQAIDIDIYPELNPLISDYKVNANTLNDALKSTFTYFDMKDYELDDMAKAKEFHKPTLVAYENFFAVNNALRHLTDSIQDGLEMVYLNGLKEKGETFNYLIGMSIHNGELMLKTAEATDYESLKAEDLKKSYDVLRGTFDEISAYKESHPDEFEGGGRMYSYLNALRDYTLAANELYIRKKDNRPFSTGEKMTLNNAASFSVEGSVPKLLDKYNKMIANYNMLVQ